MNEQKKVEAATEVNEVIKKGGGVAAFFDLDGTLVALPSLERRLFRTLRYQRALSTRNYFSWLKEAFRLMPRGISAILHENKMYLRGLHIVDEHGDGDVSVSTRHNAGRQAGRHDSVLLRHNPSLPAPVFLVQAMDQVTWHAKQGHEIVMISGTLEPLARDAARALESELAAHGIAATIRVCATRLEVANDECTGRILGEAMFGESKARAAKRLALEMRFDLARCYAYGDSTSDRWLLAEVGKPVAVNPSEDLASIARRRGWPILNWDGKEALTPRRRERRRITVKKEHGTAITERFLV